MKKRSSFVFCWMIVLVSAGSVFGAAVQGDKDLRIYVKKDTWQETVIATRTNIDQRLANQKDILSMIELGNWYMTEPFTSEDFEAVHVPVKDIDIHSKDKDGGEIWFERPAWDDGIAHLLPEGSPAATYIYRTITVPRAMQVTASLGSNDGLEIWLNGEKLLSKDVSRSVDADQDRVALNLITGKNEFLFKVYNRAAVCGFYFSIISDTSMIIWDIFQRDFPAVARWLKTDLKSDEYIKLFDERDNTRFEKSLAKKAVYSTGPLGKNIRAEYEKYNSSDTDPGAAVWLDLYGRAGVFRENLTLIGNVDLRTTEMSIRNLWQKYPDKYPNGQKYLDQIEEFAKRQLQVQKTKVAGKVDKELADALEAEVAAFQYKALVAENPLMDFDKLVFVKRYTYQSSHYYTDYIDGCRDYGGNLCVFSLKDGKVTELVPELEGGIFGRFDLSFDAKKVVFDYKAGLGQGFRIYEVGIDGKGLRQLTFNPEDEKQRIEKYWLRWHKLYRHHTDDMHPCYLPDGDICFISTRCERGILCDGPDILTSTVLHRMKPDGSNIQMISEGSVSEEVPSIMNDGRILYTRWEYVDKGGSAVKCLWAMRPDGSGSVEIYGNDHAFPSFYNGRAVPGHNNLFMVIGGPHMPYGVGTVIRLDIEYPIRSRTPMTYITPEIDIKSEWGYRNLVDGKWVETRKGPLFDDPFPLSDKYFLVTYNPDKDVHDKKAYGLYLLDEFENRILIHRDDEMSCFQPMPLKPRVKPPVLPSFVSDSTEKSEPAEVLLSDVYVGLDGVERGTIKYLRIMEHVARPWAARRFWKGDETGQQHSVISKRTNLGLRAMIGIVPVKEDGSAKFTVPSGKNIFFEALDENFMEVQRMRTFVDFLPGEKRSCIGCHEYREFAPANKTVLAMKEPTVRPGPQPGEIAPRAIYYPVDVQPIFDKHCIRCHSGDKPKGKLDLSGEMTELFSKSYENILSHRLVTVIDEIGPKMGNVDETPPYTYSSHKSKLVQMILKGHKKVKLSREEFIKLVTWVDSNAQYYGSYYGRKNLQYKDHPNFRPVPTYETATARVAPIPEKDR